LFQEAPKPGDGKEIVEIIKKKR